MSFCKRFSIDFGFEKWSPKPEKALICHWFFNDFGDFEGYIHELDADTGMITGLTKTNLKSISQVAVFSDKLFAQDIDGSIVGFNLK